MTFFDGFAIGVEVTVLAGLYLLAACWPASRVRGRGKVE